MNAIVSQITSFTIVYSTIYSDADQRKHQSSVSLAFVWGIHRGPVNSPHKWPVTRKMFPFDDVIMRSNMEFCRAKYAYNGPFNEPINFGIPGLIFQVPGLIFRANVFQFGANIRLKMLIDRCSRLNPKRDFSTNLLRVLQLRILKIPFNAFTSIIYFGSFSNVARTFIFLRYWMSSTVEILPH